MISVIVPVFNSKDTIEKCVSSILNQKYQDFEIIIIDDGSNDGSELLCEQLASKHDKIKVVHKKNGGLSSARNLGIDKAIGDFVAFIDSDDFVDNSFLFTLHDLAIKNSASIVSCGITKYYDSSSIKSSDCNNEVFIFEGSESLKEYLIQDEIKIYHSVCNKLLKRSLFTNIRFMEGKYHEDLFIMFDLLKECKKLVVTNKNLYFYYKGNENSICSNYNEKKWDDNIEAVNYIYNNNKNNSDIKNELTHFYINQCLSSLILSYEIECSIGIIKKRFRLKKIIIKTLWQNKKLSLIYKFKILTKTMFSKTYYRYRSRLRKKIKSSY